jgi:hypothetical protein
LGSLPERSVLEELSRLKIIFATQPVTDIGSVGHDLVVVQFTTEVDKQSQKVLHENVQKQTFLCEREAFIDSNAVNVLVFRAKPKQN